MTDLARAEGVTDGDKRLTVSVCALLTTFNRREKTLVCLKALQDNRREGIDLHAVLVDDRSTDGTAQAVRREFPWVDVEVSDGDLYWCRGMRRAWTRALQGRHDFYLWLNDDTVLEPHAVTELLRCHEGLAQSGHAPAIVVGTTCDPQTGAWTYGGQRHRHPWNPLSFQFQAPGEEPLAVETFTGNVVLVNSEAARRVGNLDARFAHAMGDVDYGIRARKAGVGVWLAPGLHGRCSRNDIRGTHQDITLSFRQRWTLMMGRKGLPPASWWVLCRNHAGWKWPIIFAWPYGRLLFSHFLRRKDLS